MSTGVLSSFPPFPSSTSWVSQRSHHGQWGSIAFCVMDFEQCPHFQRSTLAKGLTKLLHTSVCWYRCSVRMTVLLRAQNSSSIKLVKGDKEQKINSGKKKIKKRRLINPNLYWLSDCFWLRLWAARAVHCSLAQLTTFFGSYSHSCSVPGRYIPTQMHAHG